MLWQTSSQTTRTQHNCSCCQYFIFSFSSSLSRVCFCFHHSQIVSVQPFRSFAFFLHLSEFTAHCLSSSCTFTVFFATVQREIYYFVFTLFFFRAKRNVLFSASQKRKRQRKNDEKILLKIIIRRLSTMQTGKSEKYFENRIRRDDERSSVD